MCIQSIYLKSINLCYYFISFLNIWNIKFNIFLEKMMMAMDDIQISPRKIAG